jgi:hypothetical protein
VKLIDGRTHLAQDIVELLFLLAFDGKFEKRHNAHGKNRQHRDRDNELD